MAFAIFYLKYYVSAYETELQHCKKCEKVMHLNRCDANQVKTKYYMGYSIILSIV